MCDTNSDCKSYTSSQKILIPVTNTRKDSVGGISNFGSEEYNNYRYPYEPNKPNLNLPKWRTDERIWEWLLNNL